MRQQLVKRARDLGRRLSLGAAVMAVCCSTVSLVGCGVGKLNRSVVPKAAAARTLEAPVPNREVLSNGLTILWQQKEGLPLVSITAVVRSGSAHDPAKRPGLAGFMGAMLKRGTTTRDAKAIADTVETLGASLSVSVDEDAISIGTTVLEENFDAVFDVMADVMLRPTFPKSEVKRVRQERRNALALVREDPRRMASLVFKKVLYGAHPYAHGVLGQEAALDAMRQRDLKAYYENHLRPANTGFVVVAAHPEQAVAAIRKHFGSWKGSAGVQGAPEEPQTSPAGVFLVEKANAPQSQLRIGHLGVSRDHPDYYPLLMCNAILGGLFNSRINMNLREDKGYTYGARSRFSFMRGRGPFVVSTGVRTDATDLAIREVLKEIELIRTSDVTAEELTNAKNRYVLSLPGSMQTVDGVAGMLANVYMYDLPLDYYRKLPKNIMAVETDDVRRVAQAHLKPSDLAIVVVGDRTRVSAGLGDLRRGPIQLRDADGNSIERL